jgi:hypothetical protein
MRLVAVAGGSGWCLLSRGVKATTGGGGGGGSAERVGDGAPGTRATGSSRTRGEGAGGWQKVKECRDG